MSKKLQNSKTTKSGEMIHLEDNQMIHGCPEASTEVTLTQKKCKVWPFLKKNAFVSLTMIAVAAGIGLGFALRQVNMSASAIMYVTFPGELLMRILQMMMLPLVVCSLIAGASNVDIKASGRIGLRATCYYMVTTVIAGFTGIALALSIKPGKSGKTSYPSDGKAEVVQNVDTFLDLIRNMFPSNLVEACFRKYKTVYESSANHLDVMNASSKIPKAGTSDGINILGLLVFSFAFGLILSHMESKGKPLKDFFICLNEAIMLLVNMVIWYSPVGILCLLAGQVVKMTDTADVAHEVAMYAMTVIVGLVIHSVVTLPLIYFIVTRNNPLRFFGGVLEALTTAFGTSSSSATLPVTLHCMERNHNMDKRVTRFMLPMGATVNMDGAALYEAVSVLFISQIHNMDFNFGQIIALSLIVTAASTGAAGIPQAGMVNMLIILELTGLPTENISLLIIVDWILDRLRTVTNVLGDCIGVGVVQHLSKPELWDSSPARKMMVEDETQSL
ncbi:excitatory amino acid transporter 1-like [Nematolebias whitei]|uniref:excitatory amino acid transporter 1-like n=1 Tax=Nematolebias whitei TaxID=451745 RepID=UPI00189B55D7|nr:excitatory amino acid transporter 1-like [Nematolebias whitei]